MLTRKHARSAWQALASNPPRGSKLAAAKEFGVDLTLMVRRLGMTPNQRVREMENALRFMEALRKR